MPTDHQRRADGRELPMVERVLHFSGERGRDFDLIATHHADGEVRLAIIPVPSPRPDQVEADR